MFFFFHYFLDYQVKIIYLQIAFFENRGESKMSTQIKSYLINLNEKNNRFIYLMICFLIAIGAFGNTSQVIAQNVRVKVELQLDALPDEKREKLQGFQQILEDYFNNYQWTQDEFQGELPIGLKKMVKKTAGVDFPLT